MTDAGVSTTPTTEANFGLEDLPHELLELVQRALARYNLHDRANDICYQQVLDDIRNRLLNDLSKCIRPTILTLY